MYLCGLPLLLVTSEPAQGTELERATCLPTRVRTVSNSSWTFSGFGLVFGS